MSDKSVTLAQAYEIYFFNLKSAELPPYYISISITINISVGTIPKKPEKVGGGPRFIYKNGKMKEL